VDDRRHSDAIAFGLNRAQTGTLTTDDYTFAPAAGTPPDTTIATKPAASSTSTDASFSFTSTVADSTFTCTVDGASSPCTSPKSLTGLAVGPHTFSVAAKNAAGDTDPTPASYAWTVVPTATPTPDPAPMTLFSETFDSPLCPADLWGTNPGVIGACPRPEISGASNDSILYSVSDLDKSTKVGSTNGSAIHASMHRWQSYGLWNDPAVMVSADVKILGWNSGVINWNGFALYVRRAKAQNDTTFYGVIPFEHDGHYHIEKKCVGAYSTNSTLRPFETGTVSNGVPYAYYLLDNASAAPLPTSNVWHKLAASAKNQADGSVLITMFIDGQQRLQVKDYPGLTGCAPQLTGGTGWRTDNLRYSIDDFKLESMP
jgi:hypothetical protein